MKLDDWITSASHFDFEGHRIAYWTAGEGRPLLLVHGYPTSSWDWHRVWEPLSRDRRLIACDMLGFGLSDKPGTGYSIHRQTDLQEALLTELGVEAFDAVVHDYGVSVGQELIARKDEGSAAHELGRMAILNGGLFPHQHRMLPIQRLGISPLGFLVGLLMNRKRFGANFSLVFGEHSKPTEQELDEFWRLITEQDGHRQAHKLMHYIADRRQHRDRWVMALLQTFVPLKLINGGLDPVSGKHLYDYFRDVAPASEAVCLEDVGHYPQTEAPERVLAELRTFL